MTASVGADVEALCSKCGDVWHVVVAKVGDQIVKVHCKECNKEHRYKNPNGMAAKKAASTPRAPRAERAPVERFDKPQVAADLARAVRPYRATEAFSVGDRVDHASFGQGVVEIAEPGKITVFFATGRRVLAQAKTPDLRSTELQRPKPFDHANPSAGGKPVPEV